MVALGIHAQTDKQTSGAAPARLYCAHEPLRMRPKPPLARGEGSLLSILASPLGLSQARPHRLARRSKPPQRALASGPRGSVDWKVLMPRESGSWAGRIYACVGRTREIEEAAENRSERRESRRNAPMARQPPGQNLLSGRSNAHVSKPSVAGRQSVGDNLPVTNLCRRLVISA